MNRPGRLPIGGFLFILLLTACDRSGQSRRDNSLQAALLHCATEYSIRGLSFRLVHEGRLWSEYHAADAGNRLYGPSSEIRNNFILPLLLDALIKDTVLCAKDTIAPGVTISDLVATPADRYQVCPEDRRYARLAFARMGRPDSTARAATFVKNKLRLSGGDDVNDIFDDLGNISAYLDENFPEFGVTDDSIPDLFPGGYTAGVSRFYGWRILKFQGNTILWNCFQEGENTLLVIKSMEKKVLFTASYHTGDITSPFDHHRQDLLQCPLGLALVEALYIPAIAGVDYSQKGTTLAPVLGSLPANWQFLVCKDLWAHADLFDRHGDSEQAGVLRQILLGLTGDSLLLRYMNVNALAVIEYVSNNLQAAVPFQIYRDTTLQLFAGGQSQFRRDYKENDYQYDNIQLFIDGGRQIHLFQFNYGCSLPRRSPVDAFRFGDLTDSSYILEAKISRKLLADGRSPFQRQYRTNVLLGDCDLHEDFRESVLSWAVRQNESFSDAAKYGRIILTNHTGSTDSNLLYALPGRPAPVIDGKVDKSWDRAPWSPIVRLYMGVPVAPYDLSGRFKALYDDSSLYVLFEITDDCRNKLGFVAPDKCWIEDAATGRIIWKMDADTTQGQGTFSLDRTIRLRRGNYLLKYMSDKDNSYEHWFGKPPRNGVYGALLYLKKP